MKQSLRHTLENGIPYYGMHNSVPQTELNARVEAAEEASLTLHKALYDEHTGNSPRVGIFGDPFSKEADKYISYLDATGRPCYGQWDSNKPASDIGVRGINPNFDGPANQTTIVHADMRALDDFLKRGAPKEVLEVMDAVASLTKFAVSQVVTPYINSVASLYGIDPSKYVRLFFPNNRRPYTLTRGILYHDFNTHNQERYRGSDGQELLIREHYDQSSYSVDLKQSSPGLQYNVSGDWLDADTDVAVFRGSGDSFLPVTAPPALHRASIRHDQGYCRSDRMKEARIRRIAWIAFVSPSHDDARVVNPSSPDTHPAVDIKL